MKRIFNKRNLMRAGAAVVGAAVALTPIMASAAPVEIQNARGQVTCGELYRAPNGEARILSAAANGNLASVRKGATGRVQQFGRMEQVQFEMTPRQLERAGMSYRVIGDGNPQIVRSVPGGRVDVSNLSVTTRGGQTLRGPEIFSHRGSLYGAALKIGGDQVLGTVAGRTADGVNIFFGNTGQSVFVNTGGQLSR